MKRFMLFLAMFASAAFAASASAEHATPSLTNVLSASASHVSVTSQTSPPFTPTCSVESVSYQLVGKGSVYFVQFSGLGDCVNSATPWTSWQYGGTTPAGWTLTGYSSLPVLRVPLRSIGSFSISFTVGDDQTGSQTCSFTPNFMFGYTATQLCH